MEKIIELEPDPIVEEYLHLARRPASGDTPEEQLEDFMADLAYLPPDLYQTIRKNAAARLGVSEPAVADLEPDQL